MFSNAKRSVFGFTHSGAAPQWRHAATALALAVTYFIAGKLGLSYASVHSSASAVWPPTGIALAAFLVLGKRAWPAIFVAAFMVNVTTAGSVLTSLGIAAGNTLEAAAGAYLLNRFAGGAACVQRAGDIFKFVALAALLATTVSATIGVLSLSVAGFAPWPQFGAIWLTWWLGDACGALIVAPLLLLWYAARGQALTSRQRGELLLLWLAVIAVGLLVFAAPVLSRYPLPFLCLPPLAWAAFRFGRREVATAIALLTLIATAATEHGLGPFVMGSRNESLLVLQLFMATLAMMALPIAALVAEHQQAVAEREVLRASAERHLAWLKAVFDQMQAAVIVAEAPSGRLVYANQQAEAIQRHPLTASDGFIDYRAWQGFHADGSAYAAHEWPLVRSVRHGEVVSAEDIEVVRGDGTRVTVRVHSAPVREAGQIVGAVVVYHDVSDQMRAQAFEQAARAEAEAANRAKDEFLAMLSHELRNPLQAIGSSVALARRAQAQEALRARSLDIIERQTAHLTRLVNDLLDVTRAATGKIQLVRQSFDLAETLRHCVQQLADAGRLQQHTIEQQIDSVRVNADPVRLEQVVMNLLTNSLKYSPAGSLIRLSLKREGNDALVRVEDNGIGIAAELLPRVFDAFTQGERSLHRGEGGLGIGLTLVQRLVQLHGGEVTALSDGPGRGSVFVVRLPCVVSDDAAPGIAFAASAQRAARIAASQQETEMIQQQRQGPTPDDFPDSLAGGEGRESPDHRVGETQRQNPQSDKLDPGAKPGQQQVKESDAGSVAGEEDPGSALDGMTDADSPASGPSSDRSGR